MLFQPQYNVTSFKIKPNKIMDKPIEQDGFVIDGDLAQLSDSDLNSLMSRLETLKVEREKASYTKKREIVFQQVEELKSRIKTDMQSLRELICDNDLEDTVCVDIADIELMIDDGEWTAY